MSEDFNTPLAFRSVMKATDIFYSKVKEGKSFAIAIQLWMFLNEANYVFGFVLQEEPSSRDDERFRQLIELLIAVRKNLREKGIYDLADGIRRSLAQLGIELQDSGLETRYIVRK